MTDVGEEAILHLLQFLVFLILHTLAVLLHLPAVSPCQDGDEEQKIDELRPPGGPQRWLHLYQERGRLLAPYLVETGRINLQYITAWSQVGEVGSAHSILRIHLYPSVAHSLEPVFIIGMRRHIEIQARKENGDEVLMMFQYQFFCCRQGGSQDGSSIYLLARHQLLVVHPERSKDRMTRIFHLLHISRIHDVVSILRTEEQVASCQMPHCHTAEVTLSQFILAVEYHQFHFTILQALEPAKTTRCRNPYIAIPVFYQTIDHLVRHSLRPSEEAGRFILWINDEKTIERTYPYPSLMVDEQNLARSVKLNLRSLILHQVLREEGTPASWRIHEQALGGSHPDAMQPIFLEIVNHLIFLQRLVS